MAASLHNDGLSGGPPKFFTFVETNSGALLVGTCVRGISRSLDGGETWKPVDGLDHVSVNTFSDHGTHLSAATSGGLWHSYDDGLTWEQIDSTPRYANLPAGADTPPDITTFRLFSLCGGRRLAGTDQQGIWFTDDDTWAPLGADGSIVYSFAETRSGALLAGTRGHGILRSDDDGTTWRQSNSGLDDVYVHCLLTLADGSILAGTGQGLSRSTDDGQTWQPYAADIAGHRMFAIHELANGTLAVGSYAHLWVGREETWRQVDPGLTPDEAWSVHFTGNTIYAGTKTGVLASTDDGDTFTNVGGGSVVFALTESHDGTILAGGDDGVLRGPDWNPVGHLGRRAYCIFETEPGTLLAGTLTEGLYRFRDGVWAPHPEGPPHWQVYGIVRSQTGRLIACTGAIIDGEKVGGVFTSDDNGDTWCEKLAGRSYYAITQTSDGAVYAGGRRCYISVSTDDGDRWALLPLPLGQEAKMYSLFADHDNRLFVGAGGQLLRSDDHGHHWDVLDEGIDGVSVYDLGQRHDALLAAATSAGVFTSADGGDTWTAGRLR